VDILYGLFHMVTDLDGDQLMRRDNTRTRLSLIRRDVLQVDPSHSLFRRFPLLQRSALNLNSEKIFHVGDP
jgi:hypothetical protein